MIFQNNQKLAIIQEIFSIKLYFVTQSRIHFLSHLNGTYAFCLKTTDFLLHLLSTLIPSSFLSFFLRVHTFVHTACPLKITPLSLYDFCPHVTKPSQ